MKQHRVSRLLAVALSLCLLLAAFGAGMTALAAEGTQPQGEGTAASPYQIGTADELL